MKLTKISEKQYNAIADKKSRTPFAMSLMTLDVNQGLEIKKNDWHRKTNPIALANSYRKDRHYKGKKFDDGFILLRDR